MEPSEAAILARGISLGVFIVFAVSSIILIIFDVKTRRLPDLIVLPTLALALVGLVTVNLLQQDVEAALRLLVSAAVFFMVFFIAAVAAPGALGGGDIKLAMVIGAFLGHLGWNSVLLGFVAIAVIGGIWGIVLTLRSPPKQTVFAYGPSMLLGTWVSIALSAL